MYSSAEDVKKVFDIIKEKEIEFIDFRFTDFKGTWHHVSYNVKSIEEDSFKGIPFDGSSIPYWQPINRSDMQLIPDAKTAFVDPFTADPTLIIICIIKEHMQNAPDR
jgi:glutamine synthetase